MDLAVLRSTVCREARQFDPDGLTAVQAAGAVSEWAAMEKACASAKLLAALAADDAGLDGDGIVADASGTTPGRAKRQKKAAAAATKKQGPLADAFRKGQLSPEQTEAITAAVDANPDAESELVGLAGRGSTDELKKRCDKIRFDALNAEGGLAAKQRQLRCLRHWTDNMGMTRIDATLEPAAGAAVLAALRKIADRNFRAAVRAKTDGGTVEQRMADALTELAGSANGAGTGTAKGPRATVTYIVDEDGDVTVDGQPIPPEALDDVVARTDTRLQTLTRRNGKVTDIATHSRHIPQAIRDALSVRDPECVVPGCGNRRGLQIDHIHDFALGGPTSLDNLCRICPYHHRLKTMGKYRLTKKADGTFDYRPANRGRRAPPQRR